MKKWTTLWIMIMMLGVSVPALGAMSISKMRQNTRFLTDRMAYELKLSPQQYDDVYEVNYDFINNVRYLMDDVVRGYDYALERYYDFLDVRNDDLRWILSGSQYRRFLKAEYFYRPIYAQNNKWQFRIYMVYNNVNFFYFGKPHHYASYCGGHYRTHFNNVSYYRTHFHNRYHHDIYDGHYRIRHDRVTYDNHRRRDFQVNVRPPKKDNHRPATPQARPDRRPGRIITISTRSVLHAVNIIPVLIKTVVKTGVPSLRKEIQRKRIKGMTRIRINPEEEVQHTLAQCNLMAMI